MQSFCLPFTVPYVSLSSGGHGPPERSTGTKVVPAEKRLFLSFVGIQELTYMSAYQSREHASPPSFSNPSKCGRVNGLKQRFLADIVLPTNADEAGRTVPRSRVS
jgi:hypothetical protein